MVSDSFLFPSADRDSTPCVDVLLLTCGLFLLAAVFSLIVGLVIRAREKEERRVYLLAIKNKAKEGAVRPDYKLPRMWWLTNSGNCKTALMCHKWLQLLIPCHSHCAVSHFLGFVNHVLVLYVFVTIGFLGAQVKVRADASTVILSIGVAIFVAQPVYMLLSIMYHGFTDERVEGVTRTMPGGARRRLRPKPEEQEPSTVDADDIMSPLKDDLAYTSTFDESPMFNTDTNALKVNSRGNLEPWAVVRITGNSGSRTKGHIINVVFVLLSLGFLVGLGLFVKTSDRGIVGFLLPVSSGNRCVAYHSTLLGSLIFDFVIMQPVIAVLSIVYYKVFADPEEMAQIMHPRDGDYLPLNLKKQVEEPVPHHGDGSVVVFENAEDTDGSTAPVTEDPSL